MCTDKPSTPLVDNFSDGEAKALLRERDAMEERDAADSEGYIHIRLIVNQNSLHNEGVT